MFMRYDRPAAVYRFYDAAGALLYVGMSNRPWDRLEWGHRKKSWWRDVARQEVTWFRSGADALSAEARAIATEHPVHNAQPGRIVPHLGGPDAVISEGEAWTRIRALSIRRWHAKGYSAEDMILLHRVSQAEIDQALGDGSMTGAAEAHTRKSGHPTAN
jgi:hypothetical protein